ncbi:hypothetical protein EDB92DRAFT_1820526 [Lactarius akahatsu]|uniref:Uncharacterized protein n=1 Tax=Lactarius akahatsu TaxID=416441 RepID=A0AAD4Q8F3_9AGAM|nr:hypothetical protein EDB92DRAFT_1820526 [Lactarius akahatsu]
MHEVLEERESPEPQDWDPDADVGPKSESAQRGVWTQLLVAHTAVLRGLIDRRALVPAWCVAGMLSENLGYGLEGSSTAAGRNVRTDALLRFLHWLEVEGPNAELEPADVAILARAVDDWQQERYCILSSSEIAR